MKKKYMTAKPQKARTLRIDSAILEKISEFAKMERQSANGFIIKAIEERLRKLEKHKQ